MDKLKNSYWWSKSFSQASQEVYRECPSQCGPTEDGDDSKSCSALTSCPSDRPCTDGQGNCFGPSSSHCRRLEAATEDVPSIDVSPTFV
jgi:hypothetical protein